MKARRQTIPATKIETVFADLDCSNSKFDDHLRRLALAAPMSRSAWGDIKFSWLEDHGIGERLLRIADLRLEYAEEVFDKLNHMLDQRSGCVPLDLFAASLVRLDPDKSSNHIALGLYQRSFRSDGEQYMRTFEPFVTEEFFANNDFSNLIFLSETNSIGWDPEVRRMIGRVLKPGSVRLPAQTCLQLSIENIVLIAPYCAPTKENQDCLALALDEHQLSWHERLPIWERLAESFPCFPWTA